MLSPADVAIPAIPPKAIIPIPRGAKGVKSKIVPPMDTVAFTVFTEFTAISYALTSLSFA
jgi:hypothetical protein